MNRLTRLLGFNYYSVALGGETLKLPKTVAPGEDGNMPLCERPDEDSSRMHVFCLEHAIEVEQKLRSVGGVSVVLLCHQGILCFLGNFLVRVDNSCFLRLAFYVAHQFLSDFFCYFCLCPKSENHTVVNHQLFFFFHFNMSNSSPFYASLSN